MGFIKFPSLSRKLTNREALLESTKSKLDKIKLSLSKKKIERDRFRVEVNEFINQTGTKLDHAAKQVEQNILTLIIKTIYLCEYKKVNKKLRQQLRDVVLMTLEESHNVNINYEIPEWFYFQDPTPTVESHRHSSLFEVLEDDNEADEIHFNFEQSKNQSNYSKEQKLFTSNADVKQEVTKSNLRKLYLRVAALIHPDRGQNEEDRLIRNTLMQRLNSAYEKGDVCEILKVEGDFELEGIEKKNILASGFDNFIEKELERYEIEYQLFNEELLRVKRELKVLKATEFARILKFEISTKKKIGYSPVDANIQKIGLIGESAQQISHNLDYFLEKKITNSTLSKRVSSITESFYSTFVSMFK